MDNILTALSDFTLSLARMVDRIPTTFWPDVSKAFIGSLLGASLAFSFALWRDRVLRSREQKAAGNLALAILARQWSDFFRISSAVKQHRAAVLNQEPSIPIWLQILPIDHVFSDRLVFDI